MKIECPKSAIQDAIQSALRSIGVKSNTDLSGFLLFRFRPGTGEEPFVTVESFNRISTCRAPLLGARVDSSLPSGYFTVDAVTIKDCLQSIPDGDAVISLTHDGKNVVFKANKWENILPSQDGKNWPFCDQRVEAATQEARMKVGPFVEALSKISLFASKDDTHEPHLSHIYCWDGRIEANSRLAFGCASGPFAGRFVIPSVVVRPLCDFLRSGGDSEFEVLKHPEMTTFRRADGATFGVLAQQGADKIKDRPVPSLDEPTGDSFTTSRDELGRAITFLCTAATTSEKFLGFQTSQDGSLTPEVKLTIRIRATDRDHSIPVCSEITGESRKGKLSKDALESVLSVWGASKVRFDLINNQTAQGRKCLVVRIVEDPKPPGETRYGYLLNGGQVG